MAFDPVLAHAGIAIAKDLMKRVIEFPMEDGQILLVEVDDMGGSPSGSTLRGGGGHSNAVLERARVTYEQAIDNIRPAAESIIVRMRELAYPPDVIDLEFGIKLSADIGAFLASTSAEAQFTLKLTWNRILERELQGNRDIPEIAEITQEESRRT